MIIMENIHVRCLILLVILTICAVLMRSIAPDTRARITNTDLTRIPLTIGEWQGEEVPLDADVNAILETNAILARRYTRGQDTVWLVIVFYENSRVSLHLPESCYTGSGSHITSREITRVEPTGAAPFGANAMAVRGNKGNQEVLYYFESSGFRTASYPAMRWKALLSKFTRQSSTAALVRVSAYIAAEPGHTKEIVKNFAADAAPLISIHLK